MVTPFGKRSVSMSGAMSEAAMCHRLVAPRVQTTVPSARYSPVRLICGLLRRVREPRRRFCTAWQRA